MSQIDETVQNVYIRLARARARFTEKADFSKVQSAGLRFAYLPVEAAKPLIEECTSAEGITILPMEYNIVESRTHEYTRQTAYGDKPWWFECADVLFRIAGPEDYIELTVRGEAQDTGDSDKVANKVYTMAYKNLIKIVFGFSESGKDDSKFDDAREQDNDFNQGQITVKSTRKVSEDPFFGGGRK